MTTVFEHFTDRGDEAEPADRSVDEPTDLKFVGRATAAAIEEAPFSARDVADKEVSYRMLVDAGVNPGVAAKIRRWHSLRWSFESGDDLSRRSEQIRGLQDGERDWVASSYAENAPGEGEAATADADESAGGDAEVAAEAEWAAAAGEDGEREDESGGSATESVDQFAAEADWVRGASGESDDEAASADGSGDPVAAEAAWRERSKPTPLTELDGIGEVTSERLAEAGVTSVRSLATADPELVAEVTGLPESKVRRWFDAASQRAE